MQPQQKAALRDFLTNSLADKGDTAPLADSSSIFISGRLDSLAMTNLVMYLETNFEIDFTAINFDVELVDSIDEICQLIVEFGST